MTNLYIYCLFDTAQNFKGVYSSLKAVHRDALKMANRGNSSVRLFTEEHSPHAATLLTLRNLLKGKCDTHVTYRTDRSIVTIYKTRIKE